MRSFDDCQECGGRGRVSGGTRGEYPCGTCWARDLAECRRGLDVAYGWTWDEAGAIWRTTIAGLECTVWQSRMGQGGDEWTGQIKRPWRPKGPALDAWKWPHGDSADAAKRAVETLARKLGAT